MRWALVPLVLLLLLTPVATAEEAIHVDEEGRVMLFAHWGASVSQAMDEPVPMDELFPTDEPDLSEGPVLPGTSATGGAHTYRYTLTDFYGRPGPLGSLDLDRYTPAVFHFYLSADQVPWPSPAGAPPIDTDAGIAPQVTVEVTLTTGGQEIGRGHQTHDLVTLPEPAGAPVQHYAIPIGLKLDTLPAGQGLEIAIEVSQIDQDGLEGGQSLYNVHTGEAYPTGLALPIENPEALFLSDQARQEDLSLDSVRALSRQDPDTVRMYASGALGFAVAVVAITGVQLARGLTGRLGR